MPREGIGVSSIPPEMSDYSLLRDSIGDDDPGGRSSELPRRTLHDDAGHSGRRPLLSEEMRWEFQNTIAFWASVFFLQGEGWSEVTAAAVTMRSSRILLQH